MIRMDEIVRQDLEKIKSDISDLHSKIQGKTFLVTGGAGFIGSWICDLLADLGAKVICVDNLVTGSEKNLQNRNQNMQFVNSDITNFEFKGDCDYIIHLAAIPSPLVYLERPIETLNTSITGTKNILEIARRTNVKGFIFASTSEVYGDPPADMVPTSENFFGYVNPVGARAAYYEGKRIAETLCSLYWKDYKTPVRIARLFNTYGPRLDFKLPSSYGRAVINFIKQSLNNEPVLVFGDGKQTRSFCYITDTITGILRLLLIDGLDGKVINIGNQEEIKIIDLAEKIISFTNPNSKVAFKQLPEDDPLRRLPDITKAQQLLGYKPAVGLDEGLKRTIEWARVHFTM